MLFNFMKVCSSNHYSITKMKNDLRCDFARYKRAQGVGDELTRIRTFSVLLKSPGFFPILIYRFGVLINYKLKENGSHPMWQVFNLLHYFMQSLSVIFFKITILDQSEIGPGLMLSNKGNMIIGVKRMGRNCTIHSNVTMGIGIGIRGTYQPPEVGDNVTIGANSLIYGNIKIGNDTIIDDSSVLSRSIPEKSHVGGNPARILKRNPDPLSTISCNL
jgi:serine O-acetyltransferase